jgi:hypothetical protein
MYGSKIRVTEGCLLHYFGVGSGLVLRDCIGCLMVCWLFCCILGDLGNSPRYDYVLVSYIVYVVDLSPVGLSIPHRHFPPAPMSSHCLMTSASSYATIDDNPGSIYLNFPINANGTRFRNVRAYPDNTALSIGPYTRIIVIVNNFRNQGIFYSSNNAALAPARRQHLSNLYVRM